MLRFRIWYYALPVALRWLLTINVTAYLLWVLLLSHLSLTERFVWDYLAFHAQWQDLLTKPWQLVTYSFLHLGDLLHVGFNMLWLYWIGRDYEEMEGPEPILAVYLLASVGGAIVSVAGYGLVQGSPDIVIHGASASVLGVMAAVATTYPQKRIGLLFIGNVRLVYLILAFLGLDILFRMGSTTAVLAHIGGAFSGYIIALLRAGGVDVTSWVSIFFRRQGGMQLSEGRSAADSSPAAQRMASVSENDVDRILDKISQDGIESLTEEEMQILEKASQDAT